MVSKFLYSFSLSDMAPIIEMQRLAASQMAITAFNDRSTMHETLMKLQDGARQASVMAQAETASVSSDLHKNAENQSIRTYSLTYYNPETQETEVIQEHADIHVKDYAKAMIEESVGSASAIPLYQYIGSPIVREEIVPWKLEKILSEREYGTPPSAGGGAAVVPMRVIIQKTAERKIAKARDEEIKAAVAEAILRKESSELKIVEEILLLEDAIEALRNGEDIDKILEKLPALSRARYLIALKKKHFTRRQIINMLLRDALFLKKIKKKLELFTLDDLLDMVKILRKMTTS
ncbi:MAG: hypothetical protein ABH983_01710 [Candidatus Micrarchaeota archaeon]